jgi:hypothetical protein
MRLKMKRRKKAAAEVLKFLVGKTLHAREKVRETERAESY